MKKLVFILTIVASLVFLSTLTAFADGYFDTDKLDQGKIGITYKSNIKSKLVIQCGEKKYTYNLTADGKTEYFPLQLGNGQYKVIIYKNTTGNKYAVVSSKTVKLDLKDGNVVFLGSVQSINWEANPETVKKAVELTKDTKDIAKKIELLWDYMVQNNSYDYNKLAKLPTTYLPVPDKTLEEKTGICYDFSSLLASMLRAQGIPAKLIKGYAPDYAVGYHAWNEIYDEETKTWFVVDSTYDLQINKYKLKVTMKKDTEGFKKVYEY